MKMRTRRRAMFAAALRRGIMVDVYFNVTRADIDKLMARLKPSRSQADVPFRLPDLHGSFIRRPDAGGVQS